MNIVLQFGLRPSPYSVTMVKCVESVQRAFTKKLPDMNSLINIQRTIVFTSLGIIGIKTFEG